MILSDLLEDLDTLLPNPYSAEEKVVFLNKTVKEISRSAGKCDIYMFPANEYLRIYPLPYFIEGENISAVSVNGELLKPLNKNEVGDGYYLLPKGFIGFTQKLKGKSRIMIIFEGLSPFLKLREVYALSLEEQDFLAQDIRLDDEYRYLLLYGAMADIAAALEDTELSNNLRCEFNSLKSDALQGKYKKRGKYPTTRIIK